MPRYHDERVNGVKAAKQYLAEKKLKRMEDNTAWFGYFIMIVVLLFGIVVFCFGPTARSAHAGELDAWEFRFFGINYKDFEGREPLPALGGALTAFVVHELGHYVAGELVGMDVSWSWEEHGMLADDYTDKSDDSKALFHAGGFIADAMVGTVLTIIPKTRHMDFTAGFNALSSINGFAYAITDGLGEDYMSDTKNLDSLGYCGTETAVGFGLYSGILTYYSLDKVKE